MNDLQDYLAQLENPEQQQRFTELFEWILKEFSLVPRIAWNQPMFTDHETFIIGFSASKKHLSVSPEKAAMERFSEAIEASGYSQTDNLFRILWTQPIDYALLKKIIAFNIEDKASYTKFWR